MGVDLRAVVAVNARLAAIDAAERQGASTGVRVKAPEGSRAPELSAEARARIERLLLESGF